MKRSFFMLVLTFSTITFFANEKTEALPVENEIATPDFSMEDELREIRRQERWERRQEKRALKRTPEYKLLKSSLIVFGAITSSVFSVPATVLTIGYIYHVMIPLGSSVGAFFDSGFDVTSALDWWYGVTFSLFFLFISIPILLGIASVGVGIGLSATYGKYYKKHNIDTIDENHFKMATSKLSKTFRIIAITGAVFGTLFIPMFAGGIGMLCGIKCGTVYQDTLNLQTGVTLTVLGAIFSGLGFSFMSGALGAMAWLKGQTNRLSVDIGVTSGNNGELSCDKKRNAFERPSGVKLAMSVKF